MVNRIDPMVSFPARRLTGKKQIKDRESVFNYLLIDHSVAQLLLFFQSGNNNNNNYCSRKLTKRTPAIAAIDDGSSASGWPSSR
jgi:hypothetical protein